MIHCFQFCFNSAFKSNLRRYLQDYVTGGGRGNPDIANLGRKWNVCVVGSADFFEHPDINDLAFIPAMRGGAMGFNMLVGRGERILPAMLSEIWAFPRQRIFRELGRILGGVWIIFAGFRWIWAHPGGYGNFRVDSRGFGRIMRNL